MTDGWHGPHLCGHAEYCRSQVGRAIARRKRFGGTAPTETAIAHDDAGNLIDDGTFVYVYDAWNRLVAVEASNDADVTIQMGEFDGMGRRISV